MYIRSSSSILCNAVTLLAKASLATVLCISLDHWGSSSQINNLYHSWNTEGPLIVMTLFRRN